MDGVKTYDELLLKLRAERCELAAWGSPDGLLSRLLEESAEAIESLLLQRDLAFSRLCCWCRACPVEKRDVQSCKDIEKIFELSWAMGEDA